MSNSVDKSAKDSARGTFIVIGLTLSLLLGVFDVTIVMLSEPFGPVSLPFTLASLAAATSVLFVVYLISWIVIAPLLRVFKAEAVSSGLSLALWLEIFFVLIHLNNLITFSLSSSDLLKLGVFSLVAFLGAMGFYFITKASIKMHSGKGLALSLAAPFILVEAVTLLWLNMNRIGAFFSKRFFGLNFGYIGLVLLTLAVIYHVKRKFTTVGLLGGYMALVLLNALAAFITVKTFVPPSYQQGQADGDHKIKQVILITVDTLRADALSCYHSPKSAPTPNIDKLAEDGLVFTRAISAAPWTLPSVASIMTGLSPSVHGLTSFESSLPDALPTLAEYMHEAGYLTVAIGTNWALTLPINLSQGFVEYNFFPKTNSLGIKIVRKLLHSPSAASSQELSQISTCWLKSNYKKDFFLWIHYFDPHLPYTPPIDFLPEPEPPPGFGPTFSVPSDVKPPNIVISSMAGRKWLRGLYKAEVRYNDKSIGILLDLLKKMGLYDRSLIILSSDHGEEFWEHGRFEHGHSLYNELTWVPLIFKLPGSWARGRVNKPVSLQRIMPTILDLCEIKSDFPSQASLVPLLEEPDLDSWEETPIISTGLLYGDDLESVIFDNFKYIHSLTSNHEELYDLRSDPGEKDSLVVSCPDKVERARRILSKHHQATGKLKQEYHLVNNKRQKLQDEARQRLKSLGYLN